MSNAESVARLRRSARHFRRQVAFAELALEEFEDEAVAGEGERGVVAVAFVAEEGVLTVELVPGEVQVKFRFASAIALWRRARPSRGTCGSWRPQIMSISAVSSGMRSRVLSHLPLPRPRLWMSVA